MSWDRTKPMKRGTTPMSRGIQPLARGKALGSGKKTKARKEAMAEAIAQYFARFGYDDGQTAPCQACANPMHRDTCKPHHKTPRSELRKAGAKDLDKPHRLLIVHLYCHRKIHAGGMGRPKDEAAALAYKLVEDDPANAENGKILVLLP